MQCKVFNRILTVWGLSILLLLAVVWPIARAQSPELHQRLAPTQSVGETGKGITTQDIGIASVSTLYPSDDAPVQGGNPTAAAPTNHYLGAGNYADSPPPWANGLVRSYIRFDLSSLTSTYIASATLRLYQASGSDYPGQTRTVTFYRVTGSWNEASITWNNRPGYAEAVGSVATTYNYDGWVNIDVTNLVRAWVNGSQANYGLVVIGPEGISGIYRAFFSREDARSPELQINYRPPQPPVLDVWPGWRLLHASHTQPAFASSLQIFNVTSNSLNWSATQVGAAAWLGLGSASGTATPTTPGALALNITPTGLATGVYTAQIRISSNTTDVVGSPLTVTIALEVLDQLSNIYLPVILKSGGGSSQPQIVALVVGISDYQYLGPAPQGDYLPDSWGYDLYAPKYDVEDMANRLTGMGVSADNIIKLKESNATRANFIAGFNQLAQKESKDTLVIIYYSGHGGQTPDLNGDESDGYDEFIAMYDTNLEAGGYVRVITDDDLQALLATLESEHVVVIIDSCYSGGMISSAMQAMSGSSDFLRRGLANPFMAGGISAQDTLGDLVGPGRVIITAGSGDQVTWESKTLQNGIFTYFYISALQDSINDANQNKRISAEEAYWFSRDAVDMWVSTNIITTPTAHQNPDISDQHFGQVDLTWLP